jgi:hypothetical protein
MPTTEEPMDKQILHTGLIATLALGLGLSLASSRAIGYPAGAAVSMGTNPLFAKGGELSSAGTTAFTAPADQAAVITDVLISGNDQSEGCAGHNKITLKVGSEVVSEFVVGLQRYPNNTSRYESIVQLTLQSGIPIAPGASLTIENTSISNYYCSGIMEVHYTLSGYYAQP